MPEQLAVTEELNALVTQLGELVSYCEALRDGASGFAYVLPGNWQGPALNAFITSFESWAAQAEALRVGAEGLLETASIAEEAYNQTIEGLETMWSQLNAQLSA